MLVKRCLIFILPFQSLLWRQAVIPALASPQLGGEMTRLLALLQALLLSGCAGSVIGDAIAGREAVAAREDAYCQSIGLKFGSPEYANCRLVTDGQRQQRHQAAIQSAADGMQRAAENMRPVTSPPRTCTSRPVGNTVVTDCY